MAASLDYDEQAALHEASEEAMMHQEIEYLQSLEVAGECTDVSQLGHILVDVPMTPPLKHPEVLDMSPVTPPLTQVVEMLTQPAQCCHDGCLHVSPVTPPLTGAADMQPQLESHQADPLLKKRRLRFKTPIHQSGYEDASNFHDTLNAVLAEAVCSEGADDDGLSFLPTGVKRQHVHWTHVRTNNPEHVQNATRVRSNCGRNTEDTTNVATSATTRIT